MDMLLLGSGLSLDMKIHIRNVAQDISVYYSVLAHALQCPVKYFNIIFQIPY